MPASITLTVAHLPTSTSFFLSCLHPLNYVYRGRVNDTIGFGQPDEAPDFWLTQSIPGVPPGPAHVAFPAISRGKVHDFFHAALKAGGRVHGEPSVRDDCGYYSAAIIDLDGNSIEAVFRPDLVEAAIRAKNGDTNSMVSAAQSTTRSKAPTVVSSASKAKSTASSKAGSATASQAAKSSVSKAPSVAPSAVSKAPSAAPSAVSKAPSAAPSAVSKAPTAAPSAVSRAPSATPSKAPTAVSRAPSASPSQAAQSVAVSAAPPSQAPARTTLSRAPTAPAAFGSGNSYMDMLNEAKNTVAFARDIVNQARPMMSSPPATAPAASSPQSHGPSDAIVGTLLGVAAGAALHYAFSNRNNAAQPTEVASAPATPPDRYHATARSESIPSWSEERYYYYHSQPRQALPAPSGVGSARPYAIEAAPSEFSRASGSRPGGQRLIEMNDPDQTLSEVTGASTIQPRRRSSFSCVSATPSAVPKSHISIVSISSSAKSAARGAPPTSYRSPTAITMQSDAGRSQHSSHASSTIRSTDEGYASATEDRKSRVSTRSHKSHHSRRRASSASRAGTGSVVTAIRSPEQTPLPASRAASYIDDRDSALYSTHSKAAKTVIGRLTEKQLSKLEEGGRLERGQTDVTRSVIGKIKEVDQMELSSRELKPSDSVSQISSSRGSRRSQK